MLFLMIILILELFSNSFVSYPGVCCILTGLHRLFDCLDSWNSMVRFFFFLFLLNVVELIFLLLKSGQPVLWWSSNLDLWNRNPPGSHNFWMLGSVFFNCCSESNILLVLWECWIFVWLDVVVRDDLMSWGIGLLMHIIPFVPGFVDVKHNFLFPQSESFRKWNLIKSKWGLNSCLLRILRFLLMTCWIQLIEVVVNNLGSSVAAMVNLISWIVELD